MKKKTNNTVNYIQLAERTYPELTREFKLIQKEDYELFCKKQADYGLSNISLGSDLSSLEDKRVSQCSIIFRISDKVQRLLNLVVKKNSSSANEPVEDNFADITNYGTIARIVRNGKWK
jgi:hypothetical protein